MLWTLVFSAVILLLIWEALRPNDPQRLKPGRFYYTKRWLMKLAMKMNKLSRNRQKSYERAALRKKLESEVTTSKDEDEVYEHLHLRGFSADGIYVVLRIMRVSGRYGQLVVLLNVPGMGLFEHPIHPDFSVYNAGEDQHALSGCRFQYLEANRRWRVTYNGVLRLAPIDGKGKNEVYVRLSFKWESLADPFEFSKDVDVGLVADAIAKEEWTKEFFKRLSIRGKDKVNYEQWGELSGTVEIEGHETQTVHLRSCLGHQVLSVFGHSTRMCVVMHHFWIPETGMMGSVSRVWSPGGITHNKFGYITYASGESYALTDSDFDIAIYTDSDNPPDTYTFTFTAGGDMFTVAVCCKTGAELHCNHVELDMLRLEKFCDFTVNGRAAHGHVEYVNYKTRQIESVTSDCIPLLCEPSLDSVGEDRERITLTFQDRGCQSSLLVGGKGAQLALLTSVQELIDVKVPRGFCVTLAAFQQQMQEAPELGEILEGIISLVREGQSGEIQGPCSDMVEHLACCKLSSSVESAILNTLTEMFGDVSMVTLAVRSSAAGEDGGEASSAGQMQTFLGVRGQDKILEAVRKCWASAYTYQAVEYRRQHGQPIKTSVGVVIQEMVQSKVAGVLFTNDPISGSPNKMIVDASYGLGEIVVSGKTTPDTIIVKRGFDNTLEIVERKLGNKNVSIQVSDEGGTVEKQTGDKGSSCCLTDSHILSLCQAAIKVEIHFGSPRDVEWAISDNQVYLLQARPITTLDQETDDEILHEFDSPIATDTEVLTLGNIGEMMPGCVTPLTNSVFFRAIDRGTSEFQTEFGSGTVMETSSKFLLTNCGRGFLNLTYIAQLSSNSLLFDKNILELNLVGQRLEDHTLQQIALYGKPRLSLAAKLRSLYTMYTTGRAKVKIADSWYEKLKTYTVGQSATTVEALHQEIDKKLVDYYEVWNTTVVKSAKSGSWGGVVMGIVCGGAPDWSPDNYSDVALLLSQCQDVYSAEVPTAMQEIAAAMVECGEEKRFTESTEEECVAYLTSEACPAKLKQLYENFMKRHGHRCIREAEFIEKSWRVEPEKLLKVIKVILKSKAYMGQERSIPTIEEAVSKLKSPVTAVGKFLLKKWIVPYARGGVAEREFGKSVAINMVDKFKQAYWRLSDLLFQEGRLPERELMFFLTHDEIDQLIKTRSAKLINRAVRRRKILPVQSDIEFPRVCRGRPVPIKQRTEEEVRSSSFSMSGLPVSQGSVQGPARIVRSLDEASAIQRGDVLIVNYTDVGWTPYFPLIAGLVTEMGGLVSHGAVVAREYGLPCVVNVQGATKQFKLGDEVHLDGSAGIVRLLDKTE